MQEFSQLVQEWQTFYATLAASSATLVGLLFVALAVNPNLLTRAANGNIRLLARQTFTTFLSIIGIALTFLIPRTGPIGLGIPLVVIGIVGVISTLAELRAARASANQGSDIQDVSIRRSGFKGLAFALLIVIAFRMLVGAEADDLYWMLGPIMVLLFSASLNTWVLLLAVQEASSRG